MTDKEKAIVMAYTGICMLTGDKFNIFHKYIEDILDKPVLTHELILLADEIKKKSEADFMALCASETSNDWIPCSERLPEEDGQYYVTNSYLDVGILNFANDLNASNMYDFLDEEYYGRPGWYKCDSEYGDYKIDDVIAWMPCPEPYKPES